MDASTVEARAARFVDLHREGCFVIPNPWDVGTARMLVSLGAPALATTSAGFAFTLGVRDMGNVDRDTAISHARWLAEEVPVPVSADLENGFGAGPDEVSTTVAAAGQAGLAGCSIEDTTMDPRDPTYPRELAVERIVAAVEAARGIGRPFVLTARADGVLLGSYGLSEAVARIQAYAEAGADVVYVPGLGGMDDLRVVCGSVGVAVNALCAGPFTEVPLAALAEAGVRRVSLGSTLARLTHAAVRDAATAMFGSGDFTPLRGAMPGSEVDELLFPPGG